MCTVGRSKVWGPHIETAFLLVTPKQQRVSHGKIGVCICMYSSPCSDPNKSPKTPPTNTTVRSLFHFSNTSLSPFQWSCTDSLFLRCYLVASILVLFCHFQPFQGLGDGAGHTLRASAEVARPGTVSRPTSVDLGHGVNPSTTAEVQALCCGSS